MKIAYIIPAHRQLMQLERLLRILADEHTSFVIHVDRRAGDEAYEAFRKRTADLERVHHLERHLGYWGGFGVVRAALKAIRYLVESDRDFDYAVLISGQDYPLRSPRVIRAALAEADGSSFMAYHRLPFAGWGARGGLDRVEDWHVVSRRALHLRLPRKRRIPGGLAPYGGSRTWLLRRELIEYVDAYVREHPDFVRFFEHVLHPSELFFQTLLLNSPHASTIVDDHKLYLEWRGGSSPRTLTATDLPQILASDQLFGRKFDVDVDSEILDLLDARLEVDDGVIAS